MHRKACVCCGIGLVLMSAALACSQPAEPQEQPAEQTQAETLTVSAAATDEVKLTVVCHPPQSSASLRVVVSPSYREVDPGHDVTWTRNKLGPGTHSATFSINPVDQDNWPWTNTQDFPWTGDTEIVGTAKEDQERDAKKYTITVGCNDDTTTIDPRMRVR